MSVDVSPISYSDSDPPSSNLTELKRHLCELENASQQHKTSSVSHGKHYGRQTKSYLEKNNNLFFINAFKVNFNLISPLNIKYLVKK